MTRTVRPLPAVLAAGALLLGACGDGDPDVGVEPVEDLVPGDDTGAGTDDAGDVDDGADGEPAVDAGPEEGDPVPPTYSPTPDPALVADPCGPHEGREGDAFIEVVSPVSEQRVAPAEVELVGCSNVFEATVVWELYDGDGRELAGGFTTAECGTGCVGAFREVIDISAAAGEPFAELHVFSEDMSDGGGRLHLSAIPLVLE